MVILTVRWDLIAKPPSQVTPCLRQTRTHHGIAIAANVSLDC